MAKIKQMLSEEQIAKKVVELAKRIEKDFEGETESEEYTSVSSEKATRGDGFLSGLFGKGLSELIPASLFSGMPKSLGTEEILLIGIAAFLFFSSSHDVLTAVILLALIFIK
jgi:hypothetical protein